MTNKRIIDIKKVSIFFLLITPIFLIELIQYHLLILVVPISKGLKNKLLFKIIPIIADKVEKGGCILGFRVLK